MDLMAYSSVTEEDCMTLNISVLRRDTRDQLSCMLNSNKILPSPENLPRDWRGLCTLLDYTIPSGYQLTDPISKIFKFCDKITIAYFIQCLERIDRYDVIEDTQKLIISDIEFFKKQKCSLANPTLLPQNNSDFDIITEDDFYASNNGLPLPRYDAFLLFDDADIEFAKTIVNKLENDFKFKLLLKHRNLRPGVEFESQAIIRLISNRCNWLIIIVSNDFLKSSANRFIMNYVQSLAIEQSIRKIIPCVFNDCTIPQEFIFHVKLFFNKPNPFCDPWNKLQETIAFNNYRALTNSEKISEHNQKLNTEKSKTEHNKLEFSEECNKEIINKNNCQSLTENLNANVSKLKITHEKSNIEQHEQEYKTDKEESNTLSKSKNVFDRLVKSVVPKKWSKIKNKKRKVNCTSP